MSTSAVRFRRAALMAFETAEQCQAWANDFDDAWRAFMLAEAKRKRSDARWYLKHARAAERLAQNWERAA